MNLNKVASGDIAVFDANIILYAVQRASEQCRKILVRCATGDITGILPHHIVAEVMHAAMIAEARERGWVKGSNPARQLAERPDHVRALVRYEGVMRDLFATGLLFEPSHHDDFNAAMVVQRKTGLLTNDALLVATAERLRAHAILSADGAFLRLRGIPVYAPDDLV